MGDEFIIEFFKTMYENFGQWAVINFIKDRQLNGQLQHVHWHECGGCEEYTPFLDSCLVCGGSYV